MLIALLQHSAPSQGDLWKFLSDLSNLNATVRTLAAVASAVIAFFVFWPSWKQRRVNKMLARDFGADFYSPDVLERSTKYYVIPNCTSVDPSFESELRNLVVTEENLFLVLDRFLDKDSSYRHLLLLADSGMGKSSCLLNYYVRNRRRSERRRKKIAIVPLGIPEADNAIQGISNKRETTLFLDAFDEDTKAIQGHKERLHQLMDLAGEFRRVVITCRTQFFLRDEEIPRETGIIRIEPRKAGERGIYEFQKLYLSPLNDRQVERFLRRHYSLWNLRNRIKARALIQAVPLLGARPMLLAYIPDLLETRSSIRRAFQLYEALIDSWLERESRWVEKDNLRKFSEHLAVDLYCNRETRGAERVPVDDLGQLAKQWNIPLERWQLTGRSLLNRDALGNFKFAHRSIMEYLFVTRYLCGEKTTAMVDWTDQMLLFLREIIHSGELKKLAANCNFSEALKLAGLLPSVMLSSVGSKSTEFKKGIMIKVQPFGYSIFNPLRVPVVLTSIVVLCFKDGDIVKFSTAEKSEKWQIAPSQNLARATILRELIPTSADALPLRDAFKYSATKELPIVSATFSFAYLGERLHVAAECSNEVRKLVGQLTINNPDTVSAES